jgi:hypothetical protein
MYLSIYLLDDGDEGVESNAILSLRKLGIYLSNNLSMYLSIYH